MSRKPRAEFEPGRGYAQEDRDEVSDHPEPTDEEVAQVRPFAEVLPEMAATVRRGPGRPRLEAPRVYVSLRLDPDVLVTWRATGPGWQSRVNAALRDAEM